MSRVKIAKISSREVLAVVAVFVVIFLRLKKYLFGMMEQVPPNKQHNFAENQKLHLKDKFPP